MFLVCMNFMLLMLKNVNIWCRYGFWKLVGVLVCRLLWLLVMIICLLLVRFIGLFLVYLKVWLVMVRWLIYVLRVEVMLKLYIGELMIIMLVVRNCFSICLVLVVLVVLVLVSELLCRWVIGWVLRLW